MQQQQQQELTPPQNQQHINALLQSQFPAELSSMLRAHVQCSSPAEL
jgi:hypothetical protein